MVRRMIWARHPKAARPIECLDKECQDEGFNEVVHHN